MNRMVPGPSEERSFPTVDWFPEWPVEKPTLRKSAPNYLGAGAFSVGAVIFTLLGISNGVRDGHPVVVFGSLGGFLVLGGVAYLLLSSTGLSREHPRLGVSRNSDKVYGNGVTFRRKQFNPGIFITIAGVSVYGIGAWLGWRSGLGESGLLPSSKDDESGAIFALGLGILGLVSLIFLALANHWKMFVELYPSGVRRVIDLPFGFGWDTFIRWDETDSVSVGYYHPTPRSRYMPTIDLCLETPRQSHHPRLDQADRS